MSHCCTWDEINKCLRWIVLDKGRKTHGFTAPHSNKQKGRYNSSAHPIVSYCDHEKLRIRLSLRHFYLKCLSPWHCASVLDEIMYVSRSKPTAPIDQNWRSPRSIDQQFRFMLPSHNTCVCVKLSVHRHVSLALDFSPLLFLTSLEITKLLFIRQVYLFALWVAGNIQTTRAPDLADHIIGLAKRRI